MQNWKRYTARTLHVCWQDNFFDRRLRREESAEEKSWYMALNPVRVGLVKEPSEWKWFGLDKRLSPPGSPSCPYDGSPPTDPVLGTARATTNQVTDHLDHVSR
jgi:hypothetical protein